MNRKKECLDALVKSHEAYYGYFTKIGDGEISFYDKNDHDKIRKYDINSMIVCTFRAVSAHGYIIEVYSASGLRIDLYDDDGNLFLTATSPNFNN